jgi:hypothetical protein
MTEQIRERMIEQALCLAYNYICTFRPNKAIELIAQVLNMNPENEQARILFDVIYANQQGQWPKSLHETYGVNWAGESLENKSIHVFCDQGMGDTINMLRYIKLIKERWNCKVVLNYYGFFNEMERLMKNVDYVDEFVCFPAKCDFVTNILSIPAILHKMPLQMTYPTHFSIVLTTKIPSQPKLGPFQAKSLPEGFKIGVAWSSNPDNPLFSLKSIPVEKFELFKEYSLYSLLPDVSSPDYIHANQSIDMQDTAELIEAMDVIISVDTAVLHLAGAMGKKTYGLIAYGGDQRWAYKSTNHWYPSVKLFRQTEDGNWDIPLNQIKEELANS